MEGIKCNSNNPKIRDKDFLDEVCKNDIICLSEIHCGYDDDINIDGYKCFKLCRSVTKRINRHFGGIAIYYKEELKDGIKFMEHKNGDYVWIKLSKYFFGIEEDYYLCYAYIPPVNSSYYTKRDQDTLEYIEADIQKFSEKGLVLLCGDLNLRVGCETDFIVNDCISGMEDNGVYEVDSSLLARNSEDNSTLCSRGKQLIDLCIAAKLRIINGRIIGDSQGRYTCHKSNGSSVIDYVCAHEKVVNNILYLHVNKFLGNLSDHCCLSWAIKCRNKYVEDVTRLLNTNAENFPVQFKWNEQSIMKFQEAFTHKDIVDKINRVLQKSIDNNRCDIDFAVQEVNDILIETAKRSLCIKFPRKKIRKSTDKKWYDKSLEVLKKEVQYNSKLLQKYPNTPSIRRAFFRSLKLYNKTRKYKARKFKEKLLTQLEDLRSNNPQAYWKLLQELKEETDQTKSSQIPLKEWEIYFKNLNQDKNNEFNTNLMKELREIEKENVFNETDFTIKASEISTCIKKLKNKKSPGLDSINNEMVKYSQHALLPILVKIFNSVLQSGKYPEAWLKGYIVPIYKGDDVSDPKNYRGITITNCIGKLFNSVINNRLDAHFNSRNIIDECQIGFRKDSRTSDHMFVLKSLINKYTGNGKKLYVCFVDFHKAFDSINHTALLYKLKRCGIGTLMYNVIKDMYVNHSSRLAVKIGNSLSDFFSSNIGVHQGDVLSPNLFNLYINDVVTALNSHCDPVYLNNYKIDCLLYADDLVLLSSSEKGLQESVNVLDKYCKEWNLKVNLKKSQVIVFNKAGKFIKTDISIGGNLIESTKTYKYLGIQFTTNGKFNVAKLDRGKRGLKASFKLQSIFKDSSPSFNTCLHLFDHVVKPVLLYGSDVWGIFQVKDGNLNFNNLMKDEIEKCQLKFCRYGLGVSKKAPNIGVLGETGRLPLSIEAVYNAIKYFYRIVEMPDDSLLYQAYSDDCLQNTKDSWSFNVKSLLQNIGINPMAKINNMGYFLRNLRNTLNNIYIQHWKNELFNDKNKLNQNKLRNYRTYKTDFRREEYLSQNKSIRSSFTKLRLSAHKLHIETGRYKNVNEKLKPQDRVCDYCSQNKCEDEPHFIMHCNLYDELRTVFFHDIIDKFPMFKDYDRDMQYIWLMANVDEFILNKLTKYVQCCFVKRNESPTIS